MTAQVIFTGGPCSGKTSTLTELEFRGFQTTPEAATDIIRHMEAKGIKEPWNHEDFQKNVISLQKSRMAHASKKVEVVFQDRGPWDAAMYQEMIRGDDPCEWLNVELDLAKKDYSNLVFLFENLGFCKADGIRHEDTTQALDIERRLEATYKKHGFEVIRVKKDSVENRAELICLTLREKGLLKMN